MSNKHIIMSGYFGYDNAGDEAILASIIQSIREVNQQQKHHSLTFTVLSGNPERTQKEHGVHAIHRTDLKEIWKHLKQADVMISGGGSLLQDKTGPLTVPYYLGMIHLAQLAKVPVVVYSQGIGPVQRKFFHKWIHQTFKRVDEISVRDPKSGQLLQDWGVSKEAIDTVIDPVFLLQPEQDVSAEEILTKEQIELKQAPIMFAIRSWDEGPEDLKKYASICDKLIEDGEIILFVPMHYPSDAETAVEIMSYMTQEVQLLQNRYTPTQLMNLVSHGKLMVGMRLHALIFAAARHVPCLGISYDPKVDAFLDLLDQRPAAYAGNLQPERLYQKVKDALQNRDELQATLKQKNEQLREKALIPAERVVQILNG